MLRCCQCYGWTVEVHSKLLALQKRNSVLLFWYASLVLSASPSRQISVRVMARIAPVCRADSLVDEAGMICSTTWRPESNTASDGKPMQIKKEINGVLLTCGYIVDDSSKLDLHYL